MRRPIFTVSPDGITVVDPTLHADTIVVPDSNRFIMMVHDAPIQELPMTGGLGAGEALWLALVPLVLMMGLVVARRSRRSIGRHRMTS